MPLARLEGNFHIGKRPSKRCPSCGCLVHASAFHIQEKLTTFYVGESVLGWDKANFAGNMVRMSLCLQTRASPVPGEVKSLPCQSGLGMSTPGMSSCVCPLQIDTPEEGRALLDEALDWRGNYYFGCTGNGCVGCSSFQRCFRMLPRWALILGCIACVGALVPWAFKGSLATVNHGGTPMYFNICRLRPARSHAVASRGPSDDAASGHTTACTRKMRHGLALHDDNVWQVLPRASKVSGHSTWSRLFSWMGQSM